MQGMGILLERHQDPACILEGATIRSSEPRRVRPFSWSRVYPGRRGVPKVYGGSGILCATAL